MEDMNKYLEDVGAHMRPPLGIGAILTPNNTIYALFNGAAYHSPPSAVLLITNAMINKKPGSRRSQSLKYMRAPCCRLDQACY